MAQQKILIVEDDIEISEILTLYLVKNGFECLQAFDGNSALSSARTFHPNLLILDAQLPGLNGIEVCRILRQELTIPILFLSGLGDDQAKQRALDAGGTDYFTKPFSFAELLTHVNTALQHFGLTDILPIRKQSLVYPGLTIDLIDSIVKMDDNIIDLPPIEFQLLIRLARNPGWPFTTEQLYNLVWGSGIVDTRLVATHINRLRNKLEQNTAHRKYLITVWGKGYKFNDQL